MAISAGRSTGTPSGVTRFPKEIFRPSRRWVEQRFTDLRYWSEAERGGHFAAFEHPGLCVDEIPVSSVSLSEC